MANPFLIVPRCIPRIEIPVCILPNKHLAWFGLFHHPPIRSQDVPLDGFPFELIAVPPEWILTDAPGRVPRRGESVIAFGGGG